MEDPGRDHHGHDLHQGQADDRDHLDEGEPARGHRGERVARAADTSTPSAPDQRGEPQHHGDDRPRAASRCRARCAAVEWLSVHRLADDVGQRRLLGGGVRRTLLGALGQPAAQRWAPLFGRAGTGAQRRRCPDASESPPEDVFCGAADERAGGGVDGVGARATDPAPEGSCAALGLSLPLALLSDCAPAGHVARRRRPARRHPPRRRVLARATPSVARASERGPRRRLATSPVARTVELPGRSRRTRPPPSTAGSGRAGRRPGVPRAGGEPAGAVGDDAAHPSPPVGVRPAKSVALARQRAAAARQLLRRRGAASGRPARAPRRRWPTSAAPLLHRGGPGVQLGGPGRPPGPGSSRGCRRRRRAGRRPGDSCAVPSASWPALVAAFWFDWAIWLNPPYTFFR